MQIEYEDREISVASEKPGKAVKKNWELDSEKVWFHDEGKGQLPAVQKLDLQENIHLNFCPPVKFLLLKWGILMIIVWIKQAMGSQQLRKFNCWSCYWVTLKRDAR